MANKRKFETEELLGIIQNYVSNNKYIKKLKLSDLVKYALDNGYENIIYLDFSRNKVVKSTVDKFNKTIKLTDYNKLNNNINPINIDVNYVVDTCHSDKRNQKAILNMFKDNYLSLCNDLNSVNNEVSDLKAILEEKDKEIDTIKNQIKKEKEVRLKMKTKEYNDNLNIERATKSIEYLINKKCINILSTTDLEGILKRLFKVEQSDLLDDFIGSKDTTDKISEPIKTENKIIKLPHNKLNPNLFE